MKSYLLKNARVVDPARNLDQVMDLGVADGVMADPGKLDNPETIDLKGLVAAPGFIDVHVHLRQPGNTLAETVETGARAAAAGGFTSIVAMPNTNPAPDNAGAIEFLHRVAEDAAVHVLPCGCLTKGGEGKEMAGIGSLKSAGVFALSDDGRCVQDHALMRHVVEYAKSFGLVVLDHPEDYNLRADGVMNEGEWSVLLGMNGITGMAEELMVARDTMLARLVDWKIHLQHVSTAESAELIRIARRRGTRVTGEATPHHIALTDENIKKYDANYKMSPPLRSESDRQAILAALADGTLTVIATDHAPHTQTAKLVEFDTAPCGIIGLETALPVTMDILLKDGVLTLRQYVEKFTTGPADVLGFENYSLSEGRPADITVFSTEYEHVIDPDTFFSKSRNTPFGGRVCRGKAALTMVDGQVAYADEQVLKGSSK